MRHVLIRITSYPAHLEACWQEHLKSREPDAPIVISLFAGCGGSSLGYSMAGYRELLAVDWDDHAVETFKLNFPGVPVYHGDIAKLSVEDCLRITGLKPGELDVLDGSPPCQGFSTAGKRKMEDGRNSLFREYVRLLRGLQPKTLVMENVSGMIKGKMKLIFVEILRELKAAGYRISARLLNAMYYGVPQNRQRIIFIGVRKDLERESSHPRPESKSITVHQSIGADACFYNSRYRWRLIKNSPFATFTKTKSKSHQILCAGEIRYLTENELKFGASYPRSFRFRSYADAINGIGNSVPPLFMRAIASHVKRQILDYPGLPKACP